jgi:hypothetical protein
LLIERWAISRAKYTFRALTRVGILIFEDLALVLALTLANLLVEEMLVAALMFGALVLVVVKLGALAVRPVRGSV